MTTLQTVSGPLEAERAGRTLVHEHVVRGLLGHEYFDTLTDGPVREDALVAALQELARSGIATIVDASAIGAGRDVGRLERVGRASGVQIVCVTGVEAAAHEGTSFGALDASGLADVLVRECIEGVPGTGVRVGAILLGLLGEPGPFDEQVTLAAAFAYAETGLPVIASAGSCGGATWQVERLIGRGVDPERIVAVALDRGSTHWDALDAIARTGVCLGITRIGHGDMPPGARASLAAYAVRRYGAARVCLSMSSWARWVGPAPAATDAAPERGFGFLPRFLEHLREVGVTDDEIETMLVEAPRSLLAA